MDLMKVLIGDREQGFLHRTKKVFERMEIEVLGADTENAVLETVAREGVHAVFLNLMLPELNGLETLREIKARHPQLEVVALIEPGGTEIAAKALELGAMDYLVKPVGLKDLLGMAEEAFARRKRIEERIRSVRGGETVPRSGPGVPVIAVGPGLDTAEAKGGDMERMRVLLVDDEPEFLDLMAKRLGRRQVDLSTASSGAEALDAVRFGRPEVVVLDVKMGRGMDGIEVLRELRRRGEDCQVIMLTGHADTDAAMAGMELDAFDYLVKPVALSELEGRIREAWQYGRLRRTGG